MYIGIGPETGKRICGKDAFSYACERCLYGNPEERGTFERLMKECENILEFAKELVEWYYSGNWIHSDFDEKETGYIIRFSDKSLWSFYGTFEDAVNGAREKAAPKGLGFIVN